MWPEEYDNRLLAWIQLRKECNQLPFEKALTKINKWWWLCPLVEHYLHPADYQDWPSPWELLADNTYCELAKCLGILYTLCLLEHTEIKHFDIVEADGYYAVQVNDQFLLNYDFASVKLPLSVSIEKQISGDYFKQQLKRG